jgi:hypothetical protein
MCYEVASSNRKHGVRFSYLMRKYGLQKCLVILWFMKSALLSVIEIMVLFIIDLLFLSDVFFTELRSVFLVFTPSHQWFLLS